jgi:hypothetical protein
MQSKVEFEGKVVGVFETTTEAYTATQTDEECTTGTVLYIPSEGVVGLADTWPVAITKEHGELHSIRPDVALSGFMDKSNYGFTPIGMDNCQRAMRFAQSKGLQLITLENGIVKADFQMCDECCGDGLLDSLIECPFCNGTGEVSL